MYLQKIAEIYKMSDYVESEILRNSKQSEWVPTHGFLTAQNDVLTVKNILGNKSQTQINYGGNSNGKPKEKYTG